MQMQASQALDLSEPRRRAGSRRSQAGNPPPRGLGTATRARENMRAREISVAGMCTSAEISPSPPASLPARAAPAWNRCPEWGNDSEAHATQSYVAGRSARGSRLTWNARLGRPGRPPRPGRQWPPSRSRCPPRRRIRVSPPE